MKYENFFKDEYLLVSGFSEAVCNLQLIDDTASKPKKKKYWWQKLTII
jgi:hypothetical protein